MDDAVINAALAGFARGMSDFWPSEVKVSGPGSDVLDKAERFARGAEAKTGTPAALNSIYNSLSLTPGAAKTGQTHVLPYAPLTLDRAMLFPATKAQGDSNALKSGFQAAVRAGADLGSEALLITALDAALRFAWCVPSTGYGTQCDVSRYDHARSVAAIAVALRPGSPAGGKFALIGGDLSGIQSFIYTLASSGAAKSLRARSFYVQLLSEAIAQDVLRRLGLPVTSLLYVGGGGFQILAPESAVAALDEIKKDIAHRLLIAHNAAIGVTLEAITFEGARFDAFNGVHDKLGKALNTAKRRPFASVPADDLAAILGQPYGSGGTQIDFCKVTGEDTNGKDKSDFVESLEDLGSVLRRASQLAMVQVPLGEPAHVNHWRDALRMFGLSVHLLPLRSVDPDIPAEGLLRLARFTPEPPDAGALKPFARRTAVSVYYPFAQLVPFNKYGDIRLFDELAACSSGIQRWAVLRMDVDNLGQLFRNGFGDKAPITRTAGLSLSLRLFFEGWVPELAAPQKDFTNDLRDLLYIQYAGGDDVFVVGAWDAVAEYALRIRESFRQYTASNAALTISAGITLADASFPLYQAARMAGEAEDQAKRYVRKAIRKDAISFLDEVMGWDEFKQAYEQALQLSDWCGESGQIPRSLLQTLQQLHVQTRGEQDANTKRGGNKTQYTRASWLAAYQLTRVIDGLRRRESAPEVLKVVEAMQSELIKPEARTNMLALSARWAQYLIR